MNLACIRFYEELNEFLPRGKRKKLISYPFNGNPSVKDAIEAIGVPHVEVDLILVNGISVDFSFKLHDGDSVSVYPVFESFDITPLIRLRDRPLRDIRFVLDVHLGKLARYLRLCGFDTCYQVDYDDQEIISLALSDKRIILTRDRNLLKNKKVTHGYWLRSQNPGEQLKEVFRRFDLKNQVYLFKRCLECNTILIEVPKKDILSRLLPKTRQYYRKFKTCPVCERIYWSGSHYKRMKGYVEGLIKEII